MPLLICCAQRASLTSIHGAGRSRSPRKWGRKFYCSFLFGVQHSRGGGAVGGCIFPTGELLAGHCGVKAWWCEGEMKWISARQQSV